MAKAAKVDVEVTITKKGYQLDLTEDEAKALCAVMLRVGGDPDRSPRGLVEGVQEALFEAMGIGRWELEGPLGVFWETINTGGPGVIFSNYPEGRDV